MPIKKYTPQTIEKKVQQAWEKDKVFEAKEDKNKPKFYPLIEFPYPSGAGLHVGHVRPFTAMDVIARKKRMEGYNVLYPIGFDAFGLPTENFAIKTGKSPEVVTKENIANFTKQMKALGLSFDWSRQVDTTDPDYYKWTQWIFLQLFKKGLAYKKNQPINWCPKDKIGLANEEVVGGCCERCGTDVERRNKEQWMLAITKYADKLLEGLKEVDYIREAKQQQENWIGKSEGAEIEFSLKSRIEIDLEKTDANFKKQFEEDVELYGAHNNSVKYVSKEKIKVFTTRPDTIFGVTYLVVAPEHPLLNNEQLIISNPDEVQKYVENARKKSDLERTELQKEKTGVELKGVKVIHPLTQEEIPVYVADYVLGNYGTGGVMAVPAHDERDFEFAKKYNLPIKQVVAPHFYDDTNPPQKDKKNAKRIVVQGIVKHWSEDRVIQIQWKKFPWKTFVIGGAEEGENLEEAVKREIEEETGYTDIKSITKIGAEMRSEWFAKHKDENRYAFMHVFLVELGSGKKNELSDEEKEKHEVAWVDFKTIPTSFGPVGELNYIWKNLQHNSELYEGEGMLINSGEFSELKTDEAKEKIIAWLEKNNFGKRETQYKLRDWVFSRQRYWGEPIPLVYCENCKEKNIKNKEQCSEGELLNSGWIPLPESELPLTLPKVEKYEPTDTGESPLSKIEEWVNTTCPKCGGKAKRETDTMPNWAGSSWYFLRYADPHNEKDFFKNLHFKFKPEINITTKDQIYFLAFKDIYQDLEKMKINIWAVNRFLLNGINRALWLPLRTVAVMAWEKDLEKISKYLETHEYRLKKKEMYGWYFEKEEIKIEVIPVFEKENEMIAYTPHNAVQPLTHYDLPMVELGNIFDFAYRTVSPEYNLAHYKFINEHEKEDRAGLGDEEKIEFLEAWIQSKNEKLLYWNQVDWYNGGMEHTVLHLLYSRFWNQFLFDIGVVPTREPYKKRTSHGMILAKGGEKMSKSKGNVINPDEIINDEKFGADTLRTYIMFMGPFDQAVEWDMNGLVGVRRFLDKVWNYFFNILPASSDCSEDVVLGVLHKTIKKVTEDIEKMRFNTAIASLMEFLNFIYVPVEVEAGRPIGHARNISQKDFENFLLLLSVFAPHLSEEIWSKLGHKKSLLVEKWPEPKSEFLINESFELVIQINGKVRENITVATNISEEEAKEKALSSEKVKKWLDGKEPKKIIYVKGKLISIVI